MSVTTQDLRYVYDSESGDWLTVEHAKVNLTTSVGTLVAGTSGRSHRVLGFRVHASDPGEFYLMSGTTAVSESFWIGTYGGRADGYWPTGCFTPTTAGEALTGTYTGTGTCGVGVSYVTYIP